MRRFGDIAIVGTGVTGLAMARTAVVLKGRDQVASVTLVKPEGTDVLTGEERALVAAGVRIVGPLEFTERYDIAVVSPGISPSAALFVQASELAREVISEPEFAYRVSPQGWIAVTGTNGKTTTTSILAHVLQSAGRSARAVGNIGPTCIEAALTRQEGDWLVAELSSYQLFSTREFRPAAAIITNVTPDHLDWHGGLDPYTAAKLKVFSNMGKDALLAFDGSDPGVTAALDAAQSSGPLGPRQAPIDPRGTTAHPEAAAYVSNDALFVRTEDGPSRLCAVGDLMIRGEHNVANALLAAAVALYVGLTPDEIGVGLKSFAPIAHRIEPVGVVDGVSYYNDSKATNPEATMKALTAFGGSPVVLLLGGLDKGTDLSDLIALVRAKARDVVLFGQAADRFEREFERLGVPTNRHRHMEDALTCARQIAHAGDTVLLSPACASFDEFESYEHRGDAFRRLVDGFASGGSA